MLEPFWKWMRIHRSKQPALGWDRIDERVRIAVESDLREMQRAGGVSVAAAPQDSGNRPLLTGKQGRKFTGVFQKLKD